MTLPTLTTSEGRTKLEIQMADLKDLIACEGSQAWKESSLLIVRMAQTCGAVCRGIEMDIEARVPVTPLPFPMPLDMTGYAHDCLGIPNMEGRAS